MIKTSVIIPVYNTARYLRECVDSVLAQSQKELEIILVDDGSDDGSWEIAREYAAAHDDIRAVRQEHLYQGTARNRGLEMARGEFVYFMDSDDAILPELFDTCYRTCREKQLDFVMFDAKGFRYDENDRELEVPDDIVDRREMGIEDRLYTGPEFWNSFYNRHGILYVCWLLYIRRSFLLENRLFYEERTYFEDNDWMLRMYLHAERIFYLPRVFHRHRWRRGSNMLDGFTTGLMEGCFRMHRVLIRLHAEYEGRGDEKLRMIDDVQYLNLRRFGRLAEIRPAAAYLEPLSEFCDHLKQALRSEETGEYAYCVHLAAALRILRAAESWEDGAFLKKYRDLAGSASVFRLPELPENARICVFGTGKIGRYYAELMLRHAGGIPEDLFFADSGKEDGEFFGRPLYNSARLPELAPDAVVIASTKYRDEMRETAERLCPAGTKIVCVPQEIRFLA